MDELGGEGDYWADAQDLVDALGHTLLALGAEGHGAPPMRDVDAMFRDAHTLKSLFRLLNAPSLGQLAHAVEDVLDDVRRQRGGSTRRFGAALLGATEALAMSCARAQAGAPIDEGVVAAALASLAGYQAGVTSHPLSAAAVAALRLPGLNSELGRNPFPSSSTSVEGVCTSRELLRRTAAGLAMGSGTKWRDAKRRRSDAVSGMIQPGLGCYPWSQRDYASDM